METALYIRSYIQPLNYRRKSDICYIAGSARLTDVVITKHSFSVPQDVELSKGYFLEVNELLAIGCDKPRQLVTIPSAEQSPMLC